MGPMEPFKPMPPMRPLQFSKRVRWWPEELGTPSALGSQNDVHYAYFRDAHRLLLCSGKEVTTYDTGDHDITGIAQASDTRHALFSSSRGAIELSSLTRII
jgi:hypothetical protein